MAASFTARLGSNWGWYCLRGAICLLFFLFTAFVRPMDARFLAVISGAFLLVNGLCTLMPGALSAQSGTPWRWLVAEGILTMVIGLACLAAVGLVDLALTVSALVWWWSGWAFFSGMMELFAGVYLQNEAEEWLMIVGGTLSMLLGFCIAYIPGLALNYLAWSLATYAVCYGVIMIWLGARLHLETPILLTTEPGRRDNVQPTLDDTVPATVESTSVSRV